MHYLLLLLLLFSSLSSLELSIQTGRENQEEFSVLHLKSDERFLCQAEKDDLQVTTSIICAFKKRPIKPFTDIENNFFIINSKIKDKMFFIIIKPRKKMILKAIHFNLLNNSELYQVEDDYSKHWNVIGYKDKPPFLQEKKESALNINFPIEFAESEYPYVGGLDILGNPIHMTRVKDVSDYLQIKRYYQTKQYDMALELIEEVLANFPDTIFKSELLLYQIRCYHEKNEAEPLIQVSKSFIREYSSDINIAEVLADTADAYSQIALYTDADYFFDRLFDEHKQSPFYNLGLIYKARQLQNAGNNKKALVFYKKALNRSADVKIAALAAYQIILLELESGRSKKVVKYIDLILDGDRKYFSERLKESVDLAMKLTTYSNYQSAADIAGALLENMDKSSEYYEELLKNRGEWLAETDNKDEALKIFNQYLTQYKFGQYIDEVKRKKDALFFDVSDENSTKKLEDFDILMDKYQGDSIAKRALYEKAKLLLQMKRYQDILDMKADILSLDPALYKDTDVIVENAALGLMKKSLKNGECVKVVELSKNCDINLSVEWDAKLYDCYIDAGDFDKAKEIAQTHINTKVFSERVEWLEKYTKIDFELGNYTEVVDAAKELISLRDDKKKNIQTYRLLFDASQRLGDSENMLSSIQKIEELVGLKYKDIERYTQMLTYAKNIKDDMMVRNYANKIMQLQKKANSYTQSPYVEFILAQVLMNDNKNAKALEVLNSLDKRDITKDKRSRQKYLMGVLYQKLGDIQKSKESFNRSIEADANSSWAKLAKDALKLL